MSDELIVREAHGKKSVTPAGLARIETLAANGASLQTMAKELGISRPTWRRLRSEDATVKEAIDRGMGTLETELVDRLLTISRKGGRNGMVASMFMLKAKFGWSEGTLPPSVQVNAQQVAIQMPAALSKEQFDELLERTRASGAAGAPVLPPTALPAPESSTPEIVQERAGHDAPRASTSPGPARRAAREDTTSR